MTIKMVLAAAAMAAFGGAAMAADLPRRSAPVEPYIAPPLFTWTGFYAGLNAGATFDNRGGTATPSGFAPANGFATGPASGTFGSFRGAGSGVGLVGGGQVGYNWQAGMVVYGIEADIDYFGQGSGSTRTTSVANVFPVGSTFALGRRNDSGYLGTVRGRLGLTVFERTLLYVTGGLAYGDYGTSYGLARLSTGGANYDFTGGRSDTRIGYALGAGVEYALTPSISMKAEYLYADLGSRTSTLTDGGLANPGATVVSVKSDGASQLARVGVNYKF